MTGFDANANRRLSAKLHRRVCLVLTEDSLLAEEVLARKKLSPEVAGRLSDKVILIRPGRVDAVLDEPRSDRRKGCLGTRLRRETGHDGEHPQCPCVPAQCRPFRHWDADAAERGRRPPSGTTLTKWCHRQSMHASTT